MITTGTSTGDPVLVGALFPTALAETLITHWNGSAWTQVASPNPANYYNILRGVSGSGPNDVWAVGAYANSGEPNGARHPLALHWDGSNWSQVTVPTSGFAILNAVTAITPSDAWAVGSKNGYSTPVAFHWNGVAWSEVLTPAVGTGGNNLFYAVTALGADRVWAARLHQRLLRPATAHRAVGRHGLAGRVDACAGDRRAHPGSRRGAGHQRVANRLGRRLQGRLPQRQHRQPHPDNPRHRQLTPSRLAESSRVAVPDRRLDPFSTDRTQ